MPNSTLSQWQISRRNLIGAAALALIARPSWAASEVVRRVTAFGAKGVGDEHDDTKPIQAAINAVAALGGGIVLFDAPRAFYALTDALVIRPGVSLVGDGSHPLIKSARTDRQLLFPGNFHPAFLEKLRYDQLRRFQPGTHTVILSDSIAAARYRPGDQIVIADRRWGRTGTFGLTKHSWLNVVMSVKGNRLTLREPIDVDVPAEITRIADGRGRTGIPLFFHADAEITGLSFVTPHHLTMDSAALNIRFHDNRVCARSGLYGNAFQRVEWSQNQFQFTHMLAETSQNSMGCIIRDNSFQYVGGYRANYDRSQYFGMYIQEYARNMMVTRNRFELNDFNSQNFCISIALAQDTTIEDLTVTGRSVPELIYMGAPEDPDFSVTRNTIRNCTFDTGQSDRFVMIHGHGSSQMHGNSITDCQFKGTTTAKDSVRLFDVQGDFEFRGNRWNGSGACVTMKRSRQVRDTDNASGALHQSKCLAIS